MLTDSRREAILARLRLDRRLDAEEIPRRPPGPGELPLSFGQEQLWFIDRFAPGQATYNVPCAIRVRGPLEEGALRAALQRLVQRHEALRTRLVAGPDGRPAQVIDPPGPVPLPTVAIGRPDLTPAGAEPSQLREIIAAEAMRPFDLAAGPLLRCTLLRLAASEHLLLVVAHHAVFDGLSIPILVRELAALYAVEAAGQRCELPDLPVQFADYARWERGRLHGAPRSELEDYWRKTLDGCEVVQLATDRPRPVVDDFAGGLAERITSPALLPGLRDLARREGTTVYTTVLAAVLAVLHRYTGQDDLVVGTVSANRGRRELTGLIGFLVNTLAIRVDASGDPAFSSLLARVKEATVGAFAHQDLPFGKLVDTLGVPRDASRTPVFQIAFTYAEPHDAPEDAAGVEFTLSDEVRGINAAKFDLTLAAEARREGLWVECSYKTALFDEATAKRLLAHLEVLLEGVVADPAARLSRLPLLTEAELAAEAEWNDTDAPVPPRCAHQLFEARAASAPASIAARFQAERVSYQELNRQANQIARLLRSHGVGPEILVGVAMTTSPRRLAALLATWKAGGGYVPLDPALPADRLAFMITDTSMHVILTDNASTASIPPAPGTTIINLDATWDQVTTHDHANPTSTGVTPANTAYVIYTSGSTGQPKGVIVEHGQVIHFLHGMTRHWKIGPGSAVLQFAAFTFDVSVMDMFMPLLGGAKVVLAAPETLHSPPRLADLIREAGITFACLPPTVLNLLIGQDFPKLRTLLSSGEELSSELLKAWLHIGAEIYNGYGPTECSIGSVFMKLEPTTPLPPPIGRPKPNYRAYVLDPHLNPVPLGVTGELHIGGPGVSRGYLNRPELTRERFIPDPFRPGGRLYKTGDLARRRPDGTLVFAGRIDNQVKIRGLRVEPGEIETALAGHPDVTQAVVTVVTDQAGVKQLAGYLRPSDGATIDVADVRQYLARSLPGYMIPTYLMTLAELPLTAHGKIDKAALPAPRPGASASAMAPPRTVIEAVLTDLYATILGAERVGATDGFFESGGNSLQAMQLVSELRAALAVDLDISAVFLSPAPRQLATVLRDKHGFADSDLGPDVAAGLDRYLLQNPA